MKIFPDTVVPLLYAKLAALSFTDPIEVPDNVHIPLTNSNMFVSYLCAKPADLQLSTVDMDTVIVMVSPRLTVFFDELNVIVAELVACAVNTVVTIISMANTTVIIIFIYTFLCCYQEIGKISGSNTC